MPNGVQFLKMKSEMISQKHKHRAGKKSRNQRRSHLPAAQTCRRLFGQTPDAPIKLNKRRPFLGAIVPY